MIEQVRLDVLNNLKEHPKRLFHINYVTLVALTLAKKYHVNLIDTFIAAMLHDYAKYANDAFNKKNISKEKLAEFKDIKVKYHSIAAANYAKKTYDVNDDVYNAIYHHIFGRPKMSLLEKIIFVSDSVELSGQHQTISLYELALNDIDKAVLKALELTRKSLKRRGLKPHYKQMDTYNYYKEQKWKKLKQF